MTKIMPVFKNDEDKIITVITLLTSIFFIFLPSLLAMLCFKDKLSNEAYLVVKSVFNYELFLFIISLFFIIPVIGWLAGLVIAPLFAIWNTIVMIIGLCSIAKNKEVSIPVPYEFV